ncbi:MAG: VWA domain-containing protein [Granulosicoccus sp.]
MVTLPDTINWLYPLAFLALPLPLLVYFFAPAVRKPHAPSLRIPDISPYREYTSDAVRGSLGRWLKILVLGLAWLAIVTAAARPQTFADPVGVPVSGRDLLMCIDISGSMRETDLYAGNTRATRMAVVKQVAQDFVARRTGDRIGLIMFGSQAYVQTPLTYDHETVQHFLSEASVGLAGRSTAIGDAIGLGVKRLRDRPDASRVLILLTDGANSAGVVDPLEAAEMAARSGIRIHSIGVGSEQSRNGFGIQFGTQRSELDESTLKAISEVTGGQYFRARNQQELANIYQEIDRLEPTEQDEQEFRPLDELFAWPLGAALVLSLLWAALHQVFFVRAALFSRNRVESP